MRRWSALFLVALLISGCTALGGWPSRPRESAQGLFVQGLDQIASGKKARAFVLLEREFPTSPWTTRARTVDTLKRKIQEQSRALRKLQKEKDHCSAENVRLKKDAAKLSAALEKLKKLLVESELRKQ